MQPPEPIPTPGYDELVRIWLHRRITAKFVNRLIFPLVTTGLLLITLNSGSLFSLAGKLKLPFFELTVDNQPNWSLILLGMVLVLLGLWLFYRTQLDAQVSKHEQIKALSAACANPNESNLNIQGIFSTVFSYKPSAAAIRHILSLEDPHQTASDYRHAREWVGFGAEGFDVINNCNLKRKERVASIGYFATAFLGLFLLISTGVASAAVIAGKADSDVVQLLAALAFATIVMFFLAWAMLDRVKTLNCALRLLALAPISSLTSNDASALQRAMSSLDITSLEYFIGQGHQGYFYIPILVDFSSFSAVYNTAEFQLTHVQLKLELEEFHGAWSTTQNFGAFFVETGNPQLYRFNLPMDLPRDETQRLQHESYLSSISVLEGKFGSLIKAIHRYAPSLDLHATSARARNERANKALPAIS